MQQDHEQTERHDSTSRRGRILIGAVVIAVVVMVALHLTGVIGANTH